MGINTFLSRHSYLPIPRFTIVTLIALACIMTACKSPSSSIMEAASKGDLQKVETLLKANPKLVFSKDSDPDMPLHLAVQENKKHMAELLNADVIPKETFGYTPLHYAAQEGHKDVAELLLANKANVNAKGDDGNTPLHIVAILSQKDFAELLLAKGADANAKNKGGETPLIFAAELGKKDMVELLIAKGADVNLKDDYGRTPLGMVNNKHKEVAELLRRHGGHE
jgi:ankyrin repeat protein